jgi:hypothetical protein
LLEGKKNCGECHISADGTDLSVSTRTIARPEIPNVWFKHARFDHGQHDSRGITCVECHQQAYAYDKNQVWDQKGVQTAYAMTRKGAEEVMLPGISNCVQCHSPNPSRPELAAKHDCTECHTYHNGLPKVEK